MKSRTVQPLKKRGQKKETNRKKRNRTLDDTMPMRPVSSVTPFEQRQQTAGRRTGRMIGYEGYQRSIERRRKAVYAPRPEEDLHRQRPVRESGVSSVVRRARGRNADKVQYFDYDLLLVIIFLMCFGLVMLYSTSAYSAEGDFGNDMYFFSKQALIGVLGFVVMFLVSKIDYHLYGAFAVEIYVISIILMALVQTPLGVTINGARRWIGLPGNLTLQPAEVTKIAVILFISYELCRLGKKAYRPAGWGRALIYGAIAAGGVLFLTDNLSTAIIVMAITCILIFVIHPKTKVFYAIAGAGVAAIVVGVFILSQTLAESDNFRLQRIIAWLDPESHMDTGSFQVMQGLYAIGSGGFFGKGLGNSIQKLENIPEAQNDWILVVICEELGVFGVIVILCLFAFLLYRLMFIAKNAPDLYGSLIATGIFVHIALQVILNVAVVTGTLPSTGIILPFISYGGTAVLFLMAEMGIALGISRRIKLKDG